MRHWWHNDYEIARRLGFSGRHGLKMVMAALRDQGFKIPAEVRDTTGLVIAIKANPPLDSRKASPDLGNDGQPEQWWTLKPGADQAYRTA